jgi:hypothetical protein
MERHDGAGEKFEKERNTERNRERVFSPPSGFL